jgi:hypothetical protein
MPQTEFPVTIANFDPSFKLPEFPEYFECQACMSLFPDILECPSCSAKSCRECTATHAEKHRRTKPADFPNPNYSKCLLCNKIVLMKNAHSFMKELLFSLGFYCKKCKQEVPYRHFEDHIVTGLCQQSASTGAKFEDAQQIMINPNQLKNMNLVEALYIFERDTKYVHKFDLQTKQLHRNTVAMPNNFPHNFQACYSSSGQLFLIGGGDFS